MNDPDPSMLERVYEFLFEHSLNLLVHEPSSEIGSHVRQFAPRERMAAGGETRGCFQIRGRLNSLFEIDELDNRQGCIDSPGFQIVPIGPALAEQARHLVFTSGQ